MADDSESKRKEFSNWVHNILALNETKKALHKHVLDKWAGEMRDWKIQSLDTLLDFFNEVENGVVTYRHRKKWVCLQKHSECSKILDGLNKLRQNESFTISCKTELCRKVVNKDIKEPDAQGVLREISGESFVKNEKNAPQDKCNDYSNIVEGCKIVHIWCLANMFMQSESFKNNICNTGPGDTDSAMFFSMMKNCKLFELEDGDLYLKVIDVRNRLHHSPINRLKAQDSKTNLETMKTLLKQFPNAECTDAITKIDQMEQQTLFLGDVKKALYLKTFALDTDTKVDKAKGYSCGDKEELRQETEEQFQQTELVQFMTLKSTEDIKKENEVYTGKIEESARKSSRLEMKNLQDELKEYTNMLSKAMDETDFQTGDKRKADDLLANAKRVGKSFEELKDQRSKVKHVPDGFDFQTKIMTSFKEHREEVTNTKQEIADLRDQTNQTPIGNNKATENQIESGASESNGHTAKMNTVGIESQQESQNGATTPEERAVSTLMEDFEDFTYDIDEVEIFQDKTNLEPNKTSGSYETSKLPFETYCKTDRRLIASVSFRQSVTQLTVNSSKIFTWTISNKHMSIDQVLFTLLMNSYELSSEILLNRMKEVVEYGSKAKDKYYNLDQNENREHYFYFESLRINGREGLTENLKIEDVTGRSMNAVDVYGAAIKYLKGKCLDKVASYSFRKYFKDICHRLRGKFFDADLDKDFTNINEYDIFWVFTEPAVSSFGVKRCITEAAGKAGIQNENVAVIPESVAILIYCKHVPENQFGPVVSFEKYTRYLIVDEGEQTVTISTYEVTDQSIFKELEAPVEYTVNPNAVFEDFVTEIIGKKAGGQGSSSETDIIVSVGQDDRIGFKLYGALKKNFPNKRLYCPRANSKAAVYGAVLCCFTQLTVIK